VRNRVSTYRERVAEINRSRTIAASPSEIWLVLGDFSSISEWADFVDHSCLLSPAADGVGVGTTRRIQFGRDTLVERIIEFDPQRALTYDVKGFPRQLSICNRWTLTSTAGDSTVVTLTNTVDIGSGPLKRLAERIVARFGAKQLDALLDGLVKRLEKSRV
jgi:hypothetical protein